jgi:hypothetical protein
MILFALFSLTASLYAAQQPSPPPPSDSSQESDDSSQDNADYGEVDEDIIITEEVNTNDDEGYQN